MRCLVVCWIVVVFPRLLMVVGGISNGFPWFAELALMVAPSPKVTESYGFPWIPMVFTGSYGFVWVPVGFYGCP